MRWKRLEKALLLPPGWVLVLLLPAAGTLLIYAMETLEETAPLRIASYATAFYALVLCCVRIPALVRHIRKMKRENRYLRMWLEDARLRMNVTLCANVLWNGAYAAMQLGLGVYHRSAWFYALAAYYASLAVMRFFLVRHTMRHRPGQRTLAELRLYRRCGWLFLLMNLALSGMMLYMIREGRVMRHHEITTIALAAYTFTALTAAIGQAVHHRRHNSPAMSTARAISLAAACVSLLTLENTMLTTFDRGGLTQQRRALLLGFSGGAISLFIIVMACCMIAQATRKIRYMEREHGTEGNL